MEIHLLSEDTINKIAAGEVVERPVNVVKELIENAIDAGATAITCEIREGGKKMIRVTDNGCGIEKSQISKAFERHATSKIQDDSDLTRLVSLGFRGEALSSIAAVSQVEMITKTRDSLTGIRATNQVLTGFSENAPVKLIWRLRTAHLPAVLQIISKTWNFTSWEMAGTPEGVYSASLRPLRGWVLSGA